MQSRLLQLSILLAVGISGYFSGYLLNKDGLVVEHHGDASVRSSKRSIKTGDQRMRRVVSGRADVITQFLTADLESHDDLNELIAAETIESAGPDDLAHMIRLHGVWGELAAMKWAESDPDAVLQYLDAWMAEPGDVTTSKYVRRPLWVLYLKSLVALQMVAEEPDRALDVFLEAHDAAGMSRIITGTGMKPSSPANNLMSIYYKLVYFHSSAKQPLDWKLPKIDDDDAMHAMVYASLQKGNIGSLLARMSISTGEQRYDWLDTFHYQWEQSDSQRRKQILAGMSADNSQLLNQLLEEYQEYE